MYNEEVEIQGSFILLMETFYKDILFTIAPAGQRFGSRLSRIKAGMQAKKMGYRKGCPDVMIFEPMNGFHGLFIEFKTKKGAVDPEQKKFIAKLIERNYHVEVAKSTAEGIDILQKYLQPEGR